MKMYGFTQNSYPEVELINREPTGAQRTWSTDLPTSGRWKVTGVAGSGVSSFLVDTAVSRLRAGLDPDGLAVVAASKEAAARLRSQIHDQLTASGMQYAASAPLVRSVHSLAFSLLRQHLDAPVRLITGAEQDGVIRDLLQGHVEQGRGAWPEDIRPALPMLGFARQLRDVMLRVAERGVTASELIALGQEHNRPLWEATGHLLREYQQTMALTGTLNYSASELVNKALEVLEEDKDVARNYFHTVIVDDAQHLDPKSGQLLTELFPESADSLVVIGGDTEQSIFHFRGATNAFLEDFQPDPGCELNLEESFRRPEVAVKLGDSPSASAAIMADTLRRAHLDSGVAYSKMAVIVRSGGQLNQITRQLLTYGIPVHVSGTDLVLREQRVVSAIMLGLRALVEELSPTDQEALLVGPVGGADPVTLRRLKRGLRRWNPEARADDTLAQLLHPETELPDFSDLLTEREIDILTRMRSVLEAGKTVQSHGGSVEEILWAVWSATGLSDSLSAAALRGGATGSQADRDLDAMMALFDAAGDFVERHPGTSSIATFIRHIDEQELPTGVRDRRQARPDAVQILTAHSCAGQEYSLVVVTGVHEGVWPSLGETGSLFGQEDLLDYLDRGIAPDTLVSHSAARLAEERRLFHVATTRAMDKLVVIATDQPESDDPIEPSRFLEPWAQNKGVEIEKVFASASERANAEDVNVPDLRVLSRTSLISELRRIISHTSTPHHVRTQAARQLARLAQAGVPGASPQSWWSTREASSTQALPLRTKLSPSRIEGALHCPMRAVLESVAEDEPDANSTLTMARGELLHVYFEALGRGVDEEYARLLVKQAYLEALNEPQWREKIELERMEKLMQGTHLWVTNRSNTQLVGVEMDVDVAVVQDEESGDQFGIRGRMDRVEKDADGNLIIVDLKSGRTQPTKQQTAEMPQLLAYQVAVSKGVVENGAIRTATPDEEPLKVAEAVLVHPAKETLGSMIRTQPAQEPQQLEKFAQLIPKVAHSMTGPELQAQINPMCQHCRVKAICPIQPEGKVVTDV